jgi:hypothetical protein
VTTGQESRESRLHAAGFARQLGHWVAPTGGGVMTLEDAIAALDSGRVKPYGVTVPDSGVRAFSDETVAAVERMFTPPPPPSAPPWLDELADLVAKKLKRTIRAEIRAARKDQA